MFFSTRARVALTAELAEIRDRIEAVETAPTPPPWLSRVNAELSAISPEIEKVRGSQGILEDRIAEIEADRKDLVLAIAEGIEKVERAERRIKAAVQRARRQLADSGIIDDGLEAENADLQLVDGGRSEPEEVQPVHVDVETDYRAAAIRAKFIG